MAEIITIGVGRCGSRLCSSFHEIIASEHGMISFRISVDAHLTSIFDLVNRFEQRRRLQWFV